MPLTEPFLLQAARDHSLSPDQREVFLLKIFKNLSYDQLADQLHISKAACLKRMGEVYKKFEIGGAGRGKEQRLRKFLLDQFQQFQVYEATNAQQQTPYSHSGSTKVVALPAGQIELTSKHDTSTQSDISVHSLAKPLREWFDCLGYEFDKSESPETGGHFEWVIRVKARRGYDRIVVHGIRGEVKVAHVKALNEAVSHHEADEGWVVTLRRISQVARREATASDDNNLFCYTFDELIDQDVNFGNYFNWLEQTVKSKGISSNYVHLACKKAEFTANTKETIGYSRYGEEEGWIDGYVDLWLDDPAKEHLSILGEFGTGKTWFTLHYAWAALQRYQNAKKRGLERPRLPLLISLRDYAKAATIESLFLDFFRKHKISLPDYSVFEQLNRMGKLLLIFDGFDEMADRVARQSMINNFWQLARVVVPGSKAILTCRTEHFPDAKQGRDLLNAELRASTAKLTGESPQFEVLELEEFDDAQIQDVLYSRATPATAEKFISRPELLSLARRPLMIELILDALPDIEAGKPIDLARVYLYTIGRKLEQDIQSARTFTSLADKLYFLCELSWEMISTDQMHLSYQHFPDRIHQFFGDAVQSKDLDHWHYDMMGQTMLIRNEHGEYTPAHRSFLEFFVAYKLVAELGCLATDFVDIARQQSHINDNQGPEVYQWSTYFRRERNRSGMVMPIAPLQTFKPESQSYLSRTLGYTQLPRAILDLMVPMLGSYDTEAFAENQLLQILMSIKEKAVTGTDYLTGNIITLLLKISPSALQGCDLSNMTIRGADFTDANLRDVNFNSAQLEDCIFPQSWGGDLSVAFSPDGHLLAIVDSTGEISLWNVTKGEQVWQQKGHTDWIRSVAFDTSGQTLATGSHDKTIKLWDVATGKLIKTLENRSRVYSVSFSSDYNTLASGGDETVVKLWDIHIGQCRKQLTGHQSWIGTVSFGQDNHGEILASGSDDGTIRLWSPNEGKCTKILAKGEEGSVHSVVFDPESKRLASGSADKTVKLWNIETGECNQILKGHSDWVRSVSFSPDGQLLASGSNDKTIKLWNAKTGQCLRTIEAHATRVWSVAFNPDKKILASGSDDRTIKLWDTKTGLCIKTLWGNSRGLWSIAFSTDGQTLYCGSDDHRIQSWDLPSQQNQISFQGHRGRVRAIALSEKRRLLASGSDDKTIKLWNIQTGECLQTLENHNDWIWSVVFSPDGQTLASGSLDETVMLWDMQTKQHIKTLSGHTKFVWSVDWSPTDAIIASGSADQTIKLWEPETGNCLRTLQGHAHQVTSIAFAPDGKMLASGSDDETIKIWDIKTGDCLRTIDDNKGQIRSVAFSPDGQRLASGGLDRILRLWDITTDKCIRKISPHTEPILSLAFSPDGQNLASGGEAGIIYLSDINTGDCVKTLRADSPYKGMNITDTHGLSQIQQSILTALGAVSNH
ncbi:MAG: pentapeptide repeat-containing protein [Cyanobacteria bacterium P01_G01_bin.38]